MQSSGRLLYSVTRHRLWPATTVALRQRGRVTDPHTRAGNGEPPAGRAASAPVEAAPAAVDPSPASPPTARTPAARARRRSATPTVDMGLEPPTGERRRTGASGGRRGSRARAGSPSPPDLRSVADADDVDRILSGVSTARTVIPPPPAPPPPTALEGVRGGRTPAVGAGEEELDTVAHPRARQEMSPLELTRRSLNLGETVTSGAANASLEQMERRRSKFTVSGTEFDVGITEKLFPEMRRLPALFETHYGDAVVREVDGAAYFACGRRGHEEEVAEHTASSSPHRADEHAGGAEGAVDMGDSVFAEFDAETAVLSGASPPHAGGDAEGETPWKQQEPQQQQQQQQGATITTQDTREAQIDAATGSSAELAVPPPVEDAVLPRGSTRAPFIARPDGVVQLEPLGPQDCLRLLRFLLKLRNQTVEDLPKSIQRKAAAAAAAAANSPEEGKQTDSSLASPVPPVVGSTHTRLTLADVVKYLDTAPPPVLGLTESISSDPHGSAVASGSPVRFPAFLFTLYLENVSAQNALAHLATFFSIPVKAFHTRTVASKLACSSVLCAVERGRLTREHLLLINTLRHPGFVIRTSGIRELPGTCTTLSAASARGGAGAHTREEPIFGELARWDPVYETELLLRRVGGSRQEVERRMRAVRDVGAVFFTAAREASLARAATDILHGFFKSAVINALYRPKAPLAMRQFLATPNPVTAARARRVSTDATVRQLLRAFIATGGDWKESLRRTPFAWRHRWLNTLRAHMWNRMASQRLRVGGRAVMVGDAVIRREFREDVHRRMLTTVKTEHVKLVESEEEAATCSLEDVFLPFLRGRFPSTHFAPDATNHPIMTERHLLALLREHHAPQLLLGLPDEARLLLDVRGDSAPLLWRRFITRPVAMEFDVLEDKPPLASTHFDAGRILVNDRWRTTMPTLLATPSVNERQDAKGTDRVRKGDDSDASALAESTPTALPVAGSHLTPASSLMPRSAVLERTTIGARHGAGVVHASEFFDLPSADHYVVLGQAARVPERTFISARPHTPADDRGDRIYTVHIRAVTRTGVAGLAQVLREHFILAGVEQELDVGLQRKVNRVRREVDPETPLLTAPSYCEVCFNRDHDDPDACAEYRFKRDRHSGEKRLEASLRATPEGPAAVRAAHGFARPPLPPPAAPATASSPSSSLPASPGIMVAATEPAPAPAVGPEAATDLTLLLRLRLRRGQGQRWGVNLTKTLRLTGLDDVSLVREGSVAIMGPSDGGGGGGHVDATVGMHWPMSLLTAVHEHQTRGTSWEELQTLRDTTKVKRAKAASAKSDSNDPEGHESSRGDDALPAASEQAIAALLSALVEATALQDLIAASAAQHSAAPLATAPPLAVDVHRPHQAALASRFENQEGQAQANALLKSCRWRLVRVDDVPVSSRGDVASAFVTRAKQTEVVITFATPLRLTTPAPLKNAGVTRHDEASEAATNLAVPRANGLVMDTSTPPSLSSTDRNRTDLATKRWVQNLPDTLTIILSKPRAEVGSTDARAGSWGVRLHARDMTLLNLAELLAHAQHGPGRARPADANDRPSVAVTVTPPEVLTDMGGLRTRPETLAEVLNEMYCVTRVNGVVVHDASTAASVLRALSQRLRSAAAPPARGERSGLASDREEAVHDVVHLPLVLRRRAVRRSAQAGLSGSVASAADECHGNDTGTTDAVAASAEVPPNTAAPHTFLVPCTQTQQLMSAEQLHNSLATIAVNRLVLTPETAGKWGLKIQRATLRLKYIQFNRFFTFQVFTARRNHAVRMQDTLRFLNPSRAPAHSPPPTSTSLAARDSHAGLASTLTGSEAVAETIGGSSSSHRSSSGGGGVEGSGGVRMVFSYYAYFIDAVNHEKVETFVGLRAALHRAALPRRATLPPPPPPTPLSTPDAGADSSNGGGKEATLQAFMHGPESVTLSIKQLRLMRVTVTIRRGGPGAGEPSPLAPVGLSVSNSLVLLAVEAGSPMAAAITQATLDASSLRRLIGSRAGASPFSHTHGKRNGSGVAPAGLSLSSSSSSAVVAPVLAEALEGVLVALGAPTERATRAEAAQRQRAWQYDVDDDHTSSTAPATAGGQTPGPLSDAARPPGGTLEEVAAALAELAVRSGLVLEELRRCDAVDGVHLMQASLLRDFAETQRVAIARAVQRTTPTEGPCVAGQGVTGGGEECGAANVSGVAEDGSEEAVKQTLTAEARRLLVKLEEVHEEVCWRVIFAVKSGMALRTTQDLAQAVAPGVAEEELVLQQCMAAW